MQRQNKPDIKMFLWVNLEDLYMSKIFKYQMKKLMFCPFCRGSGAQSPKDIHLCQNCQGKGQVHTRIQVRPGFYQQGMEMCHYCQGQGRTVRSVCEVCKGQKLQEGYEQKEFLLEKGIPENYEIILKEQADESLDNVAQNFVYIVKTIPHPQMVRRIDDLYLNLYINLKEALLGFEKEITHLDGHIVKISKESISQQGETIKIEKKGMPKHQIPSEFGDLYVQLHIRMPHYLSPEQKQILKNTL